MSLRVKLSSFVVATLAFCFFFVAVHPIASAASLSGSTLTTSPISVDLTGAPGSTVTTTLQVQDNGLKPLTINMKLDEFKASGTNGQAQIYEPSTLDPLVKWVHFSPSSFVIQPGVWYPVTMSIDLPSTASLGYYYAVIFSPSIAVAGTSGNTVKGENAIFVLVDAHTANQVNSLKVNNFSASKSFYEFLPAIFSVSVNNNGNSFTVPEGDVYISRTKNGKTIAVLDINPGQGNVLPSTNRMFSVNWSDGFPLYQEKRIDGQVINNKQGIPEEQLVWNFSQITKFRFGKYYAHLALVYNNGITQVPINAIVSFWVIPWWLLAAFIIIIALVGLGVWTLVRTIIKKFRRRRR